MAILEAKVAQQQAEIRPELEGNPEEEKLGRYMYADLAFDAGYTKKLALFLFLHRSLESTLINLFWPIPFSQLPNICCWWCALHCNR